MPIPLNAEQIVDFALATWNPFPSLARMISSTSQIQVTALHLICTKDTTHVAIAEQLRLYIGEKAVRPHQGKQQVFCVVVLATL